jgi:membrane protein
MQLTELPDLFREAFKEWNKDNASILAAALAYYGLFSLVPLLIISTIILNALFGYGLLEGSGLSQAHDLVSRQVPGHVGDMLNRAGDQAASYRFTVLSFLVLVLGAAGLFVQTKRAFRIIWSLEGVDEPLVLGTVRSYIRSFLLIPLVAFLLLASAIATTILLPLSRYIEDLLPVHLGLLRLVTFLTSFLFVSLLFAVTYKALSEVRLSWRDVLPGSAVTAMLFSIGNYIIEVYVSISDIGSAYGAAGSVVVLLFWIYYSAQIFLFGAEFIKVTKRGQLRFPTSRTVTEQGLHEN